MSRGHTRLIAQCGKLKIYLPFIFYVATYIDYLCSTSKMTVFDVLKTSKFISRKIREAEKILNFHTVSQR